MPKLIELIPTVAGSPFALLAYAIAATSIVLLAVMLKRQRNLLHRIESLPEKDRFPALQNEKGLRLKEGMSPADYLKGQTRNYIFWMLLATLFSALVFGLAVLDKMGQFEEKDGPWVETEDNPVGYYAGVEVVVAHHVVDFNEWAPPTGIDKSSSCKVTWNVNFILRRTREEAEYFARPIAVSGEPPQITSGTHKPLWRNVVRHVDQGPRMKKYDILFDIHSEQLRYEFPLHMRTVRYGSFSDLNSEDIYINISQATRKEIVELKFSENKPGRDFLFWEYSSTDGSKPRLLDPSDLDIDTSEKDTLKYTIRNPILGNSYKISWNW